MPDNQADLSRLAIENRLLQLLSCLGGLPPEGLRVETTFAGRKVCLHVAPAGQAAAAVTEGSKIRRTPCMKDIVQTLREAPGPLTRPRLLEAMESANREWGHSTIARALADLVAAGVLANDGHHKGYYLPGEADGGLPP
jgi:hypothetical protein